MYMKFFLSVLLLILDAVLLFSNSVTGAGICASLLFLLPGLAVGWRLFSKSEDIEVAWALSLAGAFLWSLLMTFVLDALPGALARYDLFVILNILSLLTIVRIPRREGIGRIKVSLAFILLLVLSAAFRFMHLGTAEFQGDETRAMFLASGLSAGDEGILFLHRKGPAEVLLAAPALLLLGHSNEAAARFPFAFAGTIVVLAAYALARRLWEQDDIAATLAASFASCDGFLFAFSRIVQYQSILVLLLIAAFLSLSLLKSSARSPKFCLHAASAFAAGALLCHYDALFAFPALGLLCLSLLKSRGYSRRECAQLLLSPVLQFLVLCVSFYGPFLLHEHFAGTAGYLSQRFGADRLPAHNLPRYFTLLSFYGGGLSWMLLAASVTAGTLLWTIRYTRRLSAVCCGLGLVLLASSCFLVDSPSSSKLLACAGIAGLALASAPVILSGRPPIALRSLLLWCFCGLLALGFLFARPNTHFYVVHVPLALLSGLALSEAARRSSALQGFVACLVAAVLLPSFLYLQHSYLRPELEYRFVFPKALPAYVPDFYHDKLPAGAFFGFQHNSGWKAVGALYAEGSLQGSYDSNEEELITAWYLHPQSRTKENPDNFFIASRPNDPVPYSPSRVEAEFRFWGRVIVDGRRGLDIFTRRVPSGPPTRFDLDDFSAAFDGREAVFNDARAALEASPSR